MAQRRHRTNGRADPGRPRPTARNPRPDQLPRQRSNTRQDHRPSRTRSRCRLEEPPRHATRTTRGRRLATNRRTPTTPPAHFLSRTVARSAHSRASRAISTLHAWPSSPSWVRWNAAVARRTKAAREVLVRCLGCVVTRYSAEAVLTAVDVEQELGTSFRRG